MPGRRKQTNRVLILITVFLSLILGMTLTRSSADPDSFPDRDSIPDIIVADNISDENYLSEISEAPADADTSVQEEPASPAPSQNTKSEETTKPKNVSVSKGTWIWDSGKWYYQINGYYKTGWLYEDNKWYYFDQTGEMQIGWIESQKRWFFMNEDGIMQTGWVQDNQKWYHMNEDGIMQTGWLEDNHHWYYLDSEGDMQIGWKQLDDNWYYFNANGTMATGWIVDKGKRYFLDEHGIWDPSAVPDADTIPQAPEGAMVALTYDDGPGMYTDRLLNALEASGAKATFFMIGENIPNYPTVIRRMEDMGCELGNHIQNRKDLSELTKEEIRQQIDGVNQALTEITGHGAVLVRPPYDSATDLLQTEAKAPLILWSIDTKDRDTLEIPSTVESVFSSIQDGDIILMHDIHETSVAASEIIIPALTEKGYQLVTVSELASAKGVSLETGVLYYQITGKTSK